MVSNLQPACNWIPFTTWGTFALLRGTMTIRIAIAGLGSAADQLHLPALRALGSEVTLIGAADPSGDRRSWAATQGIPAT